MLAVDKESFEELVLKNVKPVVVDLWGPKCAPCLALLPTVEKLAEDYGDKIVFLKLNVTENRRMAIALKVMSVPTILFYKNGEQINRLSGEEVSIEAIKQNAEALLA